MSAEQAEELVDASSAESLSSEGVCLRV